MRDETLDRSEWSQRNGWIHARDCIQTRRSSTFQDSVALHFRSAPNPPDLQVSSPSLRAIKSTYCSDPATQSRAGKVCGLMNHELYPLHRHTHRSYLSHFPSLSQAPYHPDFAEAKPEVNSWLIHALRSSTRTFRVQPGEGARLWLTWKQSKPRRTPKLCVSIGPVVCNI